MNKKNIWIIEDHNSNVRKDMVINIGSDTGCDTLLAIPLVRTYGN